MKRNRMARRVPTWRPFQPFCCEIHREVAHLAETANVHPDFNARCAATIIYNEMALVANGKYGGIAVEDCFD